MGWICEECGEALPNGEVCPCEMIDDEIWDDEEEDDDGQDDD